MSVLSLRISFWTSYRLAFCPIETFWVRIVSGIDRYVTESMLIRKEEDIALGKPIAEARPRRKPTVTLTSVSIPVLQRKWIDMETQ